MLSLFSSTVFVGMPMRPGFCPKLKKGDEGRVESNDGLPTWSNHRFPGGIGMLSGAGIFLLRDVLRR